MQSTLEKQDAGLQDAGLHVAIIMDGNGRWAERRGLPRSAGHREGIEAVRRVVEAASDLGIAALTLFAFSADNWRRPPFEVEVLMLLLKQYLRRDVHRLVENGVRLKVIGRRDRLPEGLAQEIAAAEVATARNFRLDLTVAIDYSGRDAIANAAAIWLGDNSPERHSFTRLLARLGHGAGRDVDLMIRTGGEKRLSDFLLWECAYAELVFAETMWPDFGREHLGAAVAEFRTRERRFGGLPAARAEAPALAAPSGRP
ncbi:MAG: di-trans,poly-cis-decaprenylcistransferase [Alphaproteobacteria bacterium]|nr:di-trans,poly-cis-decaprenylcistransferase [Alphaproteobacteria bacterium]